MGTEIPLNSTDVLFGRYTHGEIDIPDVRLE
jgi:hypothetical protein